MFLGIYCIRPPSSVCGSTVPNTETVYLNLVSWASSQTLCIGDLPAFQNPRARFLEVLNTRIRWLERTFPFLLPVCTVSNDGILRPQVSFSNMESNRMKIKFLVDHLMRCKECNAGFANRSGLNKHIKQVHQMHRPHKCPKCGKGFPFACKANDHYEKVCLKRKTFQCATCKHLFTEKSNLTKHMRTFGRNCSSKFAHIVS